MQIILYYLLALGMSLFSASCGIFINWLFVLRSNAFQSNKAALEKKQKQLEELNSKDDDDKNLSKRKKKLSEDVKFLTQQISSMSMKGNIISAIFFIVFNRLARSSFSGIVCVKIPFTPWEIVSKISHAGVENENICDGGYNFVYWLGTMLFRDALTKFLGIEMPRIDFQTLSNKNDY